MTAFDLLWIWTAFSTILFLGGLIADKWESRQ